MQKKAKRKRLDQDLKRQVKKLKNDQPAGERRETRKTKA